MLEIHIAVSPESASDFLSRNGLSRLLKQEDQKIQTLTAEGYDTPAAAQPHPFFVQLKLAEDLQKSTPWPKYLSTNSAEMILSPEFCETFKRVSMRQNEAN